MEMMKIMYEYTVNQSLLEFYSVYSRPNSYKLKYILNVLQHNFKEEDVFFVKDIRENLFIHQYKLLIELENKSSRYIRNKKRFRMYLVHFYRFICQKYREDTNNRLFSKIFESILSSKSIYKIIDKEYSPVFYNRNEEPPIFDKFCIVPNIELTKSTGSKNHKFRYFDLTPIMNDKYKQDLKEFIWHSKGSILSKFNHWDNLIEFILQKIDFYKDVSFINSDVSSSEFNELFLYYFRESIEAKYNNPATIKGALKIIRSFLNFHYDKYNLTKSHFIPLSLKGLEVSEGGKVISENDLSILYDGYKQYESEYEYGRLYTIVFELFILTNLRIGEILNLERGCFDNYKEDQEYVELSYYSKTSRREKVKATIHSSIATLIGEAISITSYYVSNSEFKKYIFVHPYNRTIAYECTRLDFYTSFKKIQNKVKDRLEGADYKPYNLRHTFINNVYREGTKNDLSLLEIAAITGNSYKTARKYYRDINDDIDLYVEALAKVTFADVDINGEICISTNKKLSNRKVRDNLGSCKTSSCTFEVAECLVCKQFVTFIDRIPTFELMIEKLSKDIEDSIDQEEVKELTLIKKLVAKYLAEMYKIKEQARA